MCMSKDMGIKLNFRNVRKPEIESIICSEIQFPRAEALFGDFCMQLECLDGGYKTQGNILGKSQLSFVL